MTFVSLTTAEIDAKSPIDDDLMLKIKNNLDDLNSRIITTSNSPLDFEVIGRLSFLNTYPQKRSLAAMAVSKEFIPTLCRYGLKKSGKTGTITFDIRKHVSLSIPITEIAHQYTAGTTSIGRAGLSLNTQSISRATAQIATQSITYAKASINVNSIIGVTDYELGSNLWQYNLASAPDSDWAVGDYVLFASCTNANNNGTFQIVDVNRAGGANVVVTNASGAAQTSPSGNAQIKIMSYNYANPVDALFVLDSVATGYYFATMASHTDAYNNANFAIYKINEGGNNIWIKNQYGVTQAGVAGTADTSVWNFSFTNPVDEEDYVPGELVLTQGHSAGNNFPGLYIHDVNVGGNNLYISNPFGVAQASGGTVDCYHWVYSMPNSPSSQVTAGDSVYFSGHTNANNNGVFIVSEVNRGAIDNIVVYNVNGVTQAGAAGYVYTKKKLVKFASDQSAYFTTDSYIEMNETVSDYYNYSDTLVPFQVLEVNRGGGANYNVVIESDYGPAQASPAGFVCLEMKSIFTTIPSITASATAQEGNFALSGVTTDLDTTTLTVNIPLMLYVTNAMTGDPQDLTVSLL